jgi:DNA polymerase III subunit chi
MQVDFYQLTRDPAEKILPALADKTVSDGGRLLVVSESKEQIAIISAALWNHKAESFLAHAIADGGEGDALQPVLLSANCESANEAKFIALADGQWRDEALAFERVFYLFAPERTDDARAAWRKLGETEGVERKYWRQDGGRWVQGP